VFDFTVPEFFNQRIFDGGRGGEGERGGERERETEAERQRRMAPSYLRKITKTPDAFEETVAKALVDLESNGELKADLKDLYISSAKEIDIGGGRKAIVIHVPFRLLKSFHKIQQRLVRELEKKFSGKDVVLVGSRRMLNKTRSLKNPRPRSRTLTSVHKELLSDLVYPTEIVGKRTRYRLDGSKVLKVFLDPKVRRPNRNIARMTAR